MKKNNQKDQGGFSLIETLIAVSILMIAIAGPLSLVQAGLFSSNHQRNQVTAMYLAQEGLEYIKNLRDTNSYTQYNLFNGSAASVLPWLTGPDGSASLFVTCAAPAGCYVDPHGKLPSATGNPFVQSVNTAGNLPLRQSTNAGGVFSYSYDTGDGTTASQYTRTVVITGSGDVATVSVTMNWNDNGVARTYTVNENIYNYEQP